MYGSQLAEVQPSMHKLIFDSKFLRLNFILFFNSLKVFSISLVKVCLQGSVKCGDKLWQNLKKIRLSTKQKGKSSLIILSVNKSFFFSLSLMAEVWF